MQGPRSVLSRFAGGLVRAAHRLGADRGGAAAVFLALATIPLIGFIGIGTDTARAYLVKSRLSSSLDAAGLAGGWSFFLSSRDDDIRMFFDANFPPGYLGATVSGPAIGVDEDEETITLTASAAVPTTFMRLFGIDTVTVAAETEVTRQMQALDVVLAIDMSGSMSSNAPGGGSRIAAARNAATELVDILFGSDDTKELLNIGLVPWNGKVNVTLNGVPFDETLTTTQAVPAFVNPESPSPNPFSPAPPDPQAVVFYANNTPVPLLEAPPDDWEGCVYSRFIDDADPTTDADTLLDTSPPPGADWVAWQPIGPEGEPANDGICSTWHPDYGQSIGVGNTSCRRCLDHGITPLQNTRQTILDAIDELTDPTGTTNITQGVGWAWRVLLPEAPFTEAVANPDYELQRAIVLLTDGENFAGSGDGYKTTFGLGGGGRAEMDDRLREIADNIKADGVILYVIQFANAGGALQALLQEVASGPESPYYHFAPDSATLAQVFREVANHLSELRLSK